MYVMLMVNVNSRLWWLLKMTVNINSFPQMEPHASLKKPIELNSLNSLTNYALVRFCAFVGAVCHCGRTAWHFILQLAHLHARGGQGVLLAAMRA